MGNEPLVFSQGHGQEKSCIFVNKVYAKKNPAVIKELRRTIHMIQLTSTWKKNRLGADLCGVVDVFSVDPACMAILVPEGFQQYTKENTLRKCKPENIAVAPI